MSYERKSFSEIVASWRAESVPLPSKIPDGCIDLVNESLRFLYPDEAGTYIPPLGPDVVHVVSDRAFDRLLTEITEEGTHSLTKEWNQKIRALQGTPSSNVAPPRASFACFPSFLEKPILYKQSAYPCFASYPSDIIIARALLHEQMHRVAHTFTVFPIRKGDSLLRYAFATERFLVQNAETVEERELLEERYASLLGYVEAHESLILVEGAGINICSEDNDGEMRVVASSGNDFNEQIVETLVRGVTPVFERHIQERYSGVASEYAEQYGGASSNVASIHCQDLRSKVPSLFEELHVSDRRRLLHAYIEGRIPFIYSKLLPKRDYLT